MNCRTYHNRLQSTLVLHLLHESIVNERHQIPKHIALLGLQEDSPLSYTDLQRAHPTSQPEIHAGKVIWQRLGHALDEPYIRVDLITRPRVREVLRFELGETCPCLPSCRDELPWIL